jgi:hypothetical protein
MFNWEEAKYNRAQPGIYLHCSQHLCTAHIIEFGKALLHDVDDLYQKTNELSEQLANASNSIHEAYANAEKQCKAWRLEALKTIEQTYNDMMQPILYQQECFNKIKQEITLRLLTDAKKPLEKMQTQQIGNVQALDAVRLTLEHVRSVILVVEGSEKLLLPQSTTEVKVTRREKMKIKSVPPPLPLFNNVEDKTCASLNERFDPDVPTR